MKSGTIHTDLVQQYLLCRVCQEVVEIPRRVIRDPEQMLNLVDDTIQDHRECAANPKNPKLAALQRGFRKRMERELQSDNERGTNRDRLRRRCSGR